MPENLGYYRKRGSASYIVREVRSVRERERERYREREKERYCNRTNFHTRFNFVYFVLLAESTKFSSIRKPYTYTSVSDTFLLLLS